MAAIADVARLAGVSKSTASRALSGGGYVSDHTRARVVEAAAAIGYVASSNAASLVTGQTRNVGVVIPFISQWFFGEVLEGIESSLIRAGYDLTLYRLSTDETQRRRVFDYFLMRKRVDAVISVGIQLSAHETTMLHSLGKPVVCLGGETEGIPSVRIDDVEVARLATEHLISLGHTRIIHLGGDQISEMDFHTHSQRLTGFRLAMAQAGIARPDDFRAANFTIQSGYAAGLAVLADPRMRPTAIVAACDEIAIGAMLAARQLGIQVPAQLSIVGIDDHNLAEMFGLTTLQQNPRRQGEVMVSLVMRGLGEPPRSSADLADVDSISKSGLFPVRLVVRSSTTAPPVD
jgi:DNA-binding LacI/PurR family transcriptional regulator